MSWPLVNVPSTWPFLKYTDDDCHRASCDTSVGIGVIEYAIATPMIARIMKTAKLPDTTSRSFFQVQCRHQLPYSSQFLKPGPRPCGGRPPQRPPPPPRRPIPVRSASLDPVMRLVRAPSSQKSS